MRTFGCLGLLVVAVLACSDMSMSETAVAAETYGARVARMIVQPPEGLSRRVDLEGDVFAAANAYRRSKGKRTLRPGSDILQKAALAHAYDMADGAFVGHVASTGHNFESRMRAMHPGQMALARLSENAARERSKGPPDSAKALKLFQQWVKSGSHRRTMLSNDQTSVATAVVQKGDHLYAVQIFAGPEVQSNMMFGGSPAAPAEVPAGGLY